MNKRFFTLLIVLASILLQDCKKKDTAPDVGYGYFPVTAGLYKIYDVDSLFYNKFKGTVDTFKFQIKEIVESEFIDGEGRKAQRLERYYRLNPSQKWTIKDVWVSTRTNIHAEKVEENLKFVKLAFPVKSTTKWDGNLYNILDEQEYKYRDIHKVIFMNGLQFDSTVTVVQSEDSSLINKKIAYEIYAKNVGLIYRKNQDVKDEDSSIDFSKPLEKRVDIGFDYTYKLIEYGFQ